MHRKHYYRVVNYRITIVVGIFCLLVTVFAGISEVLAQGEKAPQEKPEKNPYERLAGKWVRPDGGYILELREVGSAGSLKAGYYNPKSIKVHSASWQSVEGKLKIFVELRDINYPGSTYNLQYDPASDRLKGKYFQAVAGQTFEVEFIRKEN
jgi:uncharacterized protein (DUF2147 family)